MLWFERHGDLLLLFGCNANVLDSAKGSDPSRSISLRRIYMLVPQFIPFQPSLCCPHIRTRTVVLFGGRGETPTLVLFPFFVFEKALTSSSFLSNSNPASG